MNPYERMAAQQRMQGGRMGRLGRLGDASGGPGSATGLPAAGMVIPSGVPAASGGSIVQGDGFYYIYNMIFAASIAAGVVSTITQQFDQVTVFKWVRSTCFADVSGAALVSATNVPLCTLKITDVGSGMSFMNSAVPLADMAGDAKLPYVLPTPQFILSNAVLQFTITNNSNATTYINLMFQMHGYKLYNYNQGVSA